MGEFSFIPTGIDGLTIIEAKVFGDQRGYFMESWNLRDFKEAGLPYQFVQDNQSSSTKNVLRGLHFQKKAPQGKLVRVISGEVFDVAIDIRHNSRTFGKWYGVVLSADKKNMFYVPEGFAHGFLVLSERAEFQYKCTRFYDPADEGGILWNDADIGIEWPMNGEPIMSQKDKLFPGWKDNHHVWESLSAVKEGND